MLCVFYDELTFAVNLSILVTDSGGVELLVTRGAVEAGLVPGLKRAGQRRREDRGIEVGKKL